MNEHVICRIFVQGTKILEREKHAMHLDDKNSHVKGVAIVTGQIISLSPCVGSVARIMTRFLFLVVNSARSWESEVFLSDDSLSEISL